MAEEKNLEDRLFDYCKQHDILFLKTFVAGGKGFPDRMLIFKDGTILFMELKSPGGKLSPHQVIWQKTLHTRNQFSVVAYNYAEAVAFIEDLRIVKVT